MRGFGSLEIDGSQKTVTVTVDGVVSKLSVVEHDGTLHLFSPVRRYGDMSFDFFICCIHTETHFSIRPPPPPPPLLSSN